MFSYNKSGELRVDPSELLVSTGQPLFDRLNNARGEGPGGVAAVRLPETAGRVFRRTDINPMGIVEDYAVACEAANRKEKGKIPGQRALLTGGPKETERAFASLQGRLRALNSVLEEVIQQALSPYINPEKHRVVSWLMPNSSRRHHTQTQSLWVFTLAR